MSKNIYDGQTGNYSNIPVISRIPVASLTNEVDTMTIA